MTVPLDWQHAVADVPRRARTIEQTATAAECAAVAAELDLPAVERLVARYELTAAAEGIYRLAGTLSARLTQRCVVTLEPVPVALELPLSAEFRAGDADTAGVTTTGGDPDAEIEVLSLPDVEPIEHGQLAVGRVVFDTLGAGLDPYPRAQGAAFDWRDPAEDAAHPRSTHPFAALARLRRPSDDTGA